jgi:hypothetical protein
MFGCGCVGLKFAGFTHPNATLPTNMLKSPRSGFYNFFRNFDRPFPEKGVRDGPTIQTNFCQGPQLPVSSKHNQNKQKQK